MIAAALCALLALTIAGCTTPAPPVPTPTPAFATEEEAFAAAEATYRAYVDALNARHADPAASPAPTEFLVGKALESELDTQRTLAEQNRSVVGSAIVTDFAGTEYGEEIGAVTAVACLDVSESRVLAADGADVTPAERPGTLKLEIDFVLVDEGLAVSHSDVAEDQAC